VYLRKPDSVQLYGSGLGNHSPTLVPRRYRKFQVGEINMNILNVNDNIDDGECL
jgi:hypothetical protein